MSRRLPGPARELLIRMLAHDGHKHSPPMDLLLKRGLARETGTDITPEQARKIYGLTERGVQVALQLTENRIGHDLCWRLS